MKKTNEQVLKFLGLQGGDKVRVEGYATYFVIVIEDGEICVEEISNYVDLWGFLNFTSMLIAGYDYEIITPKKKIGDMKCEETLCKNCPLRAIDCDITSSTLYEVLEKYLNSFNVPLKPYEKTFIDALKKELDKDVEIK